jgi:hypothetical protein
MSLKLAVAQRAQYLDNNGDPLSEGRVTYYDQGTTTEKAIFADPDGNVQLSNPLVLDVGGFVPNSGVFYSEGNYSIRVESRTNPDGLIPTYALEYMMPNVPGSDISGIDGNANVAYVNSVQDLINLTPNEYDYVFCFNYYADNIDKGGGWFRWLSSSTATTDLGMIFATSASMAVGRFIRMYESNVLTSYYGVLPNRSTNMASRIQQATTWAVARGETLEFVSGRIDIDGTVTVGVCDVQIDAGFSFRRLTPAVTSILRFNECNVSVLQDTESIADSTDSTHYVQFEGDLNFELNPAWWGAVGDGTTDDFSALSACSNSDGIVQIIKGYKIVGNVVSPMITFDKVHLIGNGFINSGIALLTINACTSTENAYNNFRSLSGDFLNYAFNFVGYAKWFFDTTCSDDQLSTLRDALTSKNLIWDRPITYTLSPLVDNQEYFVNEVKFGTLLNFTSGVNIGLINAGQYRIFSVGSSVPSAINNKVLGAWFGVSVFSSEAENAEGIQKAVIGSANGTVDFGGARVEVGATVAIPTNTNGVTIKNLYVNVNGASVPALSFTNSDVTIFDSKIEGVGTDASCNIKIINCEIIFSSSSQGITLLCETIEVRGTKLGFSGGAGWTGVVKLGSVATKATTESVIYIGNSSEGGRFEFTTGTSTNIISDNTFNGLALASGAVDESFIIVNGGSYTTIKDNNIKGVESATATAVGTFIEFVGSGESVKGLDCENNYNYTSAVGSTQKWNAYKVSGYANDGHEARVIGCLIKEDGVGFQTVLGTSVQGTYDSASGGTGTFNIYTDMIFPYKIGAFSSGSSPLFYISGIASGFTTSTQGLGLQVEAKEVTGSGGNCTIHYETRLPATTGFGISQEALIFTSVEKQRLIELGRYTI